MPTVPSETGKLAKSVRRLRLLIVEDELLPAWDLHDTVCALGHSVCDAVPTQDEAIAATLFHRPDVVLMDYRLAQGNGVDAARHISETLNVPVIFCTAYRSALFASIPSLRKTHVLGKPINAAALRDALLHATDPDAVHTLDWPS